MDLNTIIRGKEDHIKALLKILFIKDFSVEVTELYRKLEFDDFIDVLYILSGNPKYCLSRDDIDNLLVLCACYSLKIQGDNWKVIKNKLKEYDFSPVRAGLKLASINKYARELSDITKVTKFTDESFKYEVEEALELLRSS